MTDIQKQPTPEKMEGETWDAALAPPPYPIAPASMQQPAPYVAPPYPYGPMVYPAYPPVPPTGDLSPPAQEINIQDSPAGGAGTNYTTRTCYTSDIGLQLFSIDFFNFS